MLNHSHRVCQELQAPLKALKRRGDRQEHEMKEQLELQRAELQQLSTELEKAHAALQQQRGELNRLLRFNSSVCCFERTRRGREI